MVYLEVYHVGLSKHLGLTSGERLSCSRKRSLLTDTVGRVRFSS